jgi:hypothetical protein
VAHACNPSYLGGRDLEDWNQPQENSLRDPYVKKKNPSHKRASGVAQGVGPEFKSSTERKKSKVKGGWRWMYREHA